MRRTQAEADTTRTQIMHSALDLFSARGYRATTLAGVAQAAGVTRGAVYHHFADKAALYRAIVDEANERSQEVLAAAIAAGGSWEEVCRRIFVALHATIENDALIRAAVVLSLRETGSVPGLADVREHQQQTSRGLLDAVTSFMAQGVAQGTLRADLSPAQLARAFLALNQGLIHLWLAGGADFGLADASPAVVEALFNGITPRETTLTPPGGRG